MQLAIPNLLSEQDCKLVLDTLKATKFVDGRETAQGLAKEVKSNLQASSEDPKYEILQRLVLERLLGNQMVVRFARPKSIAYLMFSKYAAGMQYGTHVDGALMQMKRADISFTVFLSEPNSYEGGELVLETTMGEQTIKLPSGACFLYPSTTLHRVNEVTSGDRIVAVGWLRSYIRDPAKREVLFDIDTTRALLKEKGDFKDERLFLMKTSTNLLRMWMDD